MAPTTSTTALFMLVVALYTAQCFGFSTDSDEATAAQASETLAIDSSNSVWGSSQQHKEPSSNSLKLRALLCPGCFSRSASAYPLNLKSDSPLSNFNEMKRGFWDKRGSIDRRVLAKLMQDAPQGTLYYLH